MPRFALAALTSITSLIVASNAGATDVPGGPVSGTWNAAGSPYNVLGDITVPAGESLTIEPGVEVVFQGDYELTALGIIDAVGAVADSIHFRGVVDWTGIRLESQSTASRFEYCRIQGSDTGIESVRAPVEIVNCHLHDHTTAIDIFDVGSASPAAVEIRDTRIESCQNHGIFIVENSNTLVEGCDISGCALSGSPRGAIQLSNQTAGGNNDPTIRQNWIHHNVWQGLTAFDITGAGNIDPLIEDNVIEYNLTGIYLLHANGRVRNNQINHNFETGNPNSGAGAMVSGAAAQPVFTGNTLTGNFTAFYVVDGAAPNLGDVGNANPDDDGGNHMHDNVDPGGNTWSVYSNSVADIKAENNTWDSENFGEIATTIFDGNDNPAYGIVDFDPIYSATAIPEPGAQQRIPVSQLRPSVPNPFRSLTTIRFDLADEDAGHQAMLRIYDVRGRLIRELVQDMTSPGSHQVLWDGRDSRGAAAPAGHYFVRLAIGSRTSSERVTLVR
jgi:parallel beta-helix repeat protein